MPKLTDNMVSKVIGGSNYGFSATGLRLDASAYTLGLVVIDVSGSTLSFRAEMETALKEVVKACRSNPRSDYMMLRVVLFDQVVRELHGFKLLQDCNESDYNGCLNTGGGTTALYDATYNAVKSATVYGAELVAKEYDVNAIVFVITDGQEYPPNASTATRKMIKEALEEGVKGESLESLNSILIGLNAQGSLDQYLKELQAECGIMEYLPIADANAKTMARLGDWISQSVSSTSQAINTGGPSQSLAF